MSRRDEVAIAFFGTWMIIGLFFDGWAHRNDLPETFFSPWHMLLYSGFGAALAFFALDGARQRLRGEAVEVGPDEPLMAWGMGLFVLGAVGDFAWHEIFGIEQDLGALLSPTHLSLFIGGFLMVTGPIRSAWAKPGDAPDMRTFAPTLVCATLAAAVVSFFLMFVPAFLWSGMWTEPGEFGQLVQISGVMSVLVANTVLMGAAFILLRRWRVPAGSFTFLFTAVAFAMTGLERFEFGWHILTGLVGGVTADIIASRPGTIRRIRTFGAVVPAVMWTTWVLVIGQTSHIAWDVEVWSGAIILAVGEGAMLSFLVFPPKAPSAVALTHHQYSQRS